MKRKEDWPERLHEALLEHAAKPFAWGSTDCILSACNLIAAMTDVDPAAEFRGKYSTELGARKAIKRAGHDSLETLAEKIAADHGMQEVGPKFAHRGDLVVFDAPEGPAFGIVHLNGRDAVCIGPDGLRRMPVLQARRAWRVSY